jgi:hypothetical protein
MSVTQKQLLDVLLNIAIVRPVFIKSCIFSIVALLAGVDAR